MDTSSKFPFSRFPRLATPRLILREITADDLLPLFRICSDRDWLKLWGQPAHRHVDDTSAMLRQIRRAHEERSGLRWAITMKGNDELIGCVGFARIMWPHFRAEVTGELSRACSGKGVMAEGIRAIAVRLRRARPAQHRGQRGSAAHDVDPHLREARFHPRRVLPRELFLRWQVLRHDHVFAAERARSRA